MNEAMQEPFWQRKHSFSRGALAGFLAVITALFVYLALLEYAWVSGTAAKAPADALPPVTAQEKAIWREAAILSGRIGRLERREDATRRCLHTDLLAIRRRHAPRACV